MMMMVALMLKSSMWSDGEGKPRGNHFCSHRTTTTFRLIHHQTVHPQHHPSGNATRPNTMNGTYAGECTLSQQRRDSGTWPTVFSPQLSLCHFPMQRKRLQSSACFAGCTTAAIISQSSLMDQVQYRIVDAALPPDPGIFSNILGPG